MYFVVNRITPWLVKHRQNGVLVFDNTIIARTGKKHRMARKLKDPATGQYVTGYDLVSAHFKYYGISYPLMFEFALGKEYITRAEIACSFLQKLYRMGFGHMYVIFDNAYFAGEFFHLLDELGYTWVIKSKTNRVVEDEYGLYTSISELAGTINPEEYRQHNKYTNLWYVTKTLYLNGGYMARVVFVKNTEPRAGVDSEYFLASKWFYKDFSPNTAAGPHGNLTRFPIMPAIHRALAAYLFNSHGLRG